MAFPRPTLRDALVRHKPFLACATTQKGNTKSHRWPKVTSIHEWRAFNIDALNESYGHVIDSTLSSTLVDKLPSTNKLEGLTMYDDSGPKNIIAWNDENVMSMVNHAKVFMGLHPGASVQHSYTSADGSTKAIFPEAHSKTTVDHVITLGNSRSDVLVVGLGRTSVKWKGSLLVKDFDNTTNENGWPLRQLANLCSKAQTRYGYIQTDKELVVCYFTVSTTGPPDEYEWSAYIMPVPWNTELSSDQSAAPKTHLTTELALWWLCMLSLCDEHRPIVALGQVVAIDSWDKQQLNSGLWVRRHRYSGFEQPLPFAFPTPDLDFDFFLQSTGDSPDVTFLGETNPNM
ncbi:hypothetical protein SCUCBS95973_006434 [Sporothrix curviconia]|uniref:Uncharacterized protein n=1 Tax=Sporothrix curviconia TaxID=1260050 RepID=A0ABP0C626_9PEZI